MKNDLEVKARISCQVFASEMDCESDTPVNVYGEGFESEDDNNVDSTESRLLACAKTGSMAELKHLLSSSLVDANAVSHKEANCQGLSALHLAVRHDQLKCARLLLAYGADVDKTDKFGFRPLHDACLHGNQDAVKLLLKHGASTDGIEKKDLHLLTPVLYAARRNHVDCLKLLSNKAPLDCSLLWDTASKRGVAEILDYLPSRDIPKDIIPKLFRNSALAGNSMFIRSILQSSDYRLNDEIARMALFTAAQHGHLQYLTTLLQFGVDPDIRDAKNNTALHNAARFGQLECITQLVQSGANIEALTHHRWTPLHTTVKQCQEEAVSLFIELGCNINAKGGPMDETPLHLAAVLGDGPVLRNLLEGNPSLLVKNKSGKSVLQMDLRPSVREVIVKHAKS